MNFKSPEGEQLGDLSNYNEQGTQGPLINETSEQIKLRLADYLNNGLPSNYREFGEKVLDFADNADSETLE